MLQVTLGIILPVRKVFWILNNQKLTQNWTQQIWGLLVVLTHIVLCNFMLVLAKNTQHTLCTKHAFIGGYGNSLQNILVQIWDYIFQCLLYIQSYLLLQKYNS